MNLSISGNLLLLLSIIASFLAIITQGRIKNISFYTSIISPILAFILLVIAFITSNFYLKNVFLNSSHLQPLIYKIAASWASHEGSILLWVSLVSVVSFIYVQFFKLSAEANYLRMTILSFINILFVSFVYLTSNPFEKFSFLPQEGLGLNPVLQDTALSIHPPLLYLGYVSYIILFTNACLMLLKPVEQNNILLISKKASSFAMATLSAGIGLGSWWAYRELGWGGFWFFDPVENISLLPWLCGIALHHFLVLSINERRCVRLTVLFSILTFLLTLYGMFFVRSGIISSVHSFAFSPERGLYIALICLTISALSLLLFIYKQKLLTKNLSVNIKHRAILLGNILWIIALIVLLIGIIYPVYCSYFYKIEVAIDPEYYHSIFIPLTIPILLLAAISPTLSSNIKKHLIHMISAILVTLLINNLGSLGLISGSIIFCSVYLISQMVLFLLVQTNYFTRAASSSVLALFFGHLGFAILALSISLNTIFSFNVEFIGKVGNVIKAENMSVTLQNIKFADGPNYFRQIAEFSVHDQHNNIVILTPENRLYKVEKTLSVEADIYSYLTYDLYGVVSKIDGKTVHGQIYYRPFISFIWFAVFLIMLGFICVLLKNNKNT